MMMVIIIIIIIIISVYIYIYTYTYVHICPSLAAKSRVSVQRTSSLTLSVYYDESMAGFRAAPVICSSSGQN
jgi:hypothetical protein